MRTLPRKSFLPGPSECSNFGAPRQVSRCFTRSEETRASGPGLWRRILAGQLLTLAAPFVGACSPTAQPAVPQNPDAILTPEDRQATGTEIFFFPSRWRSVKERPPVVLVGPETFQSKVLFDHAEALVPYLTYHGYPVLLVGAKDGPFQREFGTRELPKLLQSLRRKTGDNTFIVGGVSSGGRHALRLLGALQENPEVAGGITVTQAFFLGTGFDYNYKDSFPERMAKAGVQGPTFSGACAKEASRVFCEKTFRSPLRPDGYANVLGYVPQMVEPGTTWTFVERLETPAVFMVGKIDNLSPVESVFPVYWHYGAKASKGADAVRKRFFSAGRDNGLALDFDEYSLLMDPSASAGAYAALVRWLDGN